VLRDVTERVVIASKGRFDRAIDPAARADAGLPHVATPSADEFMEATLDVWELAPESARRVGHPAPFPVELPQRLIELYTWRGDVVLDPFVGAGSTAVAAVRSGRRYLGYDTDETYAEIARRRAADELGRVLAGGGPAEPAGGTVLTVAASLLRAAGFTVDDTGRRKLGGVEVPLLATNPPGHEWLVDVVGGFTVARPGLRHTDALERALGRAARLSGFGARPLLVLATDLPPRRSAGATALAEARGRVLTDVLPIEAGERTVARLRAYAAAGGSAQPVGDLLVGE
jgi:site-specific DNA-methyltransferase (adenine-specific)